MYPLRYCLCLASLLFIVMYTAVTVFAYERVTLGFEALAVGDASQQVVQMFLWLSCRETEQSEFYFIRILK